MTSAFALFQHQQVPTGVEHAVSCQLTSGICNNLVVAKSSILSIYVLPDGSLQDSKPLKLVGDFQLWGNVESMCVTKFAGHTRDSLLVTFEYAKMSVLSWDPTRNDLATSSLHDFDSLERVLPGMDPAHTPLIRVDPQDRTLRKQVDGILNPYTIDLTSVGAGHAKDFCFLDGYLEPSLLVLHEPTPTWEGRYAVSRDTACLLAISININEQTNPLICSAENLPHDTYGLLPVPLPIGGALVLSSNAFLHFGQTVDFGLSLNEFGDALKHFSLVPTSSPLSGENARCAFLSLNQILIGLNDGDLHLLTITHHGNSVRGLELAKCGTAVYSSCICTFASQYVFIGSIIGDSVLVRYTQKRTGPEIDFHSRASKRQRASGEDTGPSDDLNWVFQSDSTANDTIGSETNYSFSLADSLTNIGSIGSMIPFKSSPGEQSSPVELVLSVGRDKNGGLAVLQGGIYPDPINSFPLGEPVTGCWTVYQDGQINSNESDPFHSFMLVSTGSRTLALSTSVDLVELDSNKCGFYTDGPTVDVGNLCDRAMIVQVYGSGVKLLRGVREIQDIPIESEFTITSASIEDPYILLLLSDGSLRLCTFDSHLGLLSISVPQLDPIEHRGHVSAMSLYKDAGYSGLFKPQLAETQKPCIVVKPERTKSELQADHNLDAVAEMLFGKEEETASVEEKVHNKDSATTQVEPDLMCVVCRGNHRLEIYRLVEDSGLERVFWASNLQLGFPILFNGLTSGMPALEQSCEVDTCNITHLLLTNIGSDRAAPHLLLLLSTGDLIVYQAFGFEHLIHHIPLRFSRVKHGFITRPLLHHQSIPLTSQKKHFVPFQNIAGKRGVFVCGRRPAFIFGERDDFRVHAVAANHYISAFCSLNNNTCSHAYVFCDLSGNLFISRLNSNIGFDCQLPITKFPFRSFVRYLVRHPPTGAYCIVTSSPTDMISMDEVTSRSLGVIEDKYELHVLSPTDMKPEFAFTEFREHEQVISIKPVTMIEEQKTHHFIAVGTAINESEEVNCRGRIILFNVYTASIVPQNTDGQGRNEEQTLQVLRLQHLYNSLEKGPVTAITSVAGQLALAVGPRIILYQWDGSILVGSGFFDAQLYSVSMSSVKNFFIFGDVMKSVHLLLWEPLMKHVTLLAKDIRDSELTACEFLVDGTDINIVSTDFSKNVQLFFYSPRPLQNSGGTILVPRGDFHIGNRINAFARLRTRLLPIRSSDGIAENVGIDDIEDLKGVSDLSLRDIERSYGAAHQSSRDEEEIVSIPLPKDQIDTQLSDRFMLLFGSAHGSIGHIVPVSALVYRCLYSLHQQLTYNIEHYAGLNPIWFRRFKKPRNTTMVLKKNIVDADLLSRYVDLDANLQRKLARNIGSNPDSLIDHLLQTQLSTRLF